MKFLCLHGTYGSAEKFQNQLSPFIDEVVKAGSAEFKWIDGSYLADPPSGFEAYFGSPPYYKFIDYDGIGGIDTITNKIRNFPEGLSPEDTLRRLTGDDDLCDSKVIIAAVDRLLDIIAADPEIDGILGYSEGATMAASVVLEERRRLEEHGTPRRIKCGVFFAGWPGIKLVDGKAQLLLADECEDEIDIPTCHIVGCADPWLQGSLALYNLCNDDVATLFDHGKGHTVPRDATTVKELAESLGESIKRGQATVCA